YSEAAEYYEKVNLPVVQANRSEGLAWALAMNADPKVRDPVRALQFAELAVTAEPKSGLCWTTLGAARFRAGNLDGAIEALKRSITLTKMTPANGFVQVMIYSAKLEKSNAQAAFDAAVQLLSDEKLVPPDLSRLRAEAAKVIR